MLLPNQVDGLKICHSATQKEWQGLKINVEKWKIFDTFLMKKILPQHGSSNGLNPEWDSLASLWSPAFQNHTEVKSVICLKSLLQGLAHLTVGY